MTPEKQRIKYEARKANHCCVECGSQDERTLAGKTYCEKCARHKLVVQKYRNELRKKQKICVSCSKQDENTLAGRVRCKECAAAYARMARKHRLLTVKKKRDKLQEKGVEE